MGKTYTGVSDIAQEVNKIYAGVNGVARQVKKVYVGDSNGIARLVFGSSLPSAYRQLEYIESDGTQYIDTGVTPKQNISKMVLQIKYNEVSGDYAVNGVGGNSNYFQIYARSNTFYAVFASGSQTVSLTPADTNIHTFTLDAVNLKATIDNTTVSLSNGTLPSNHNIYLFADNDNNTAAYFAKQRLYSAKFYESGILIRDFIPCERISDGVQGLYDLVNDLFYGFSIKLSPIYLFNNGDQCSSVTGGWYIPSNARIYGGYIGWIGTSTAINTINNIPSLGYTKLLVSWQNSYGFEVKYDGGSYIRKNRTSIPYSSVVDEITINSNWNNKKIFIYSYSSSGQLRINQIWLE